MDNPNAAAKPAKQADNDWYAFSQEKPATPQGKDQTHAPAPAAAGDQYDYNQGPKPNAPGSEKPTTDKAPTEPKPGSDKHASLTLYDVAEKELRASHTAIKSQDDIYRKLNEIMVAHGHHDAHLDGKANINDHMLPKEWNKVNPASLLDAKDTHPHHPAPTHHKPADHKPAHPHKPTDGKVGSTEQPQPAPERPPAHQQVPRYDNPPTERPQAYPPQEQPRPYYHQNDAGAQIGNVIGGVIGGIGAGLLAGALFHGGGHRYGYGGYNDGYESYPPYYGGYQNYGYGGYNGGYHGGGHHRR